MNRRDLLLLAALVLPLLAACGGGASTSPTRAGSATARPDALHVVATTTVLADLVGQVGGPDVVVVSVVPKGGEVHTFDPTPSDVARLTGADLIVMNGLGLDEWLVDFIGDAGAQDVPLVELGEDLEGVEYLEAEHEEDAHEAEPTGSAHASASPDEHGHEAVNPHLWLDVSNTRKYVTRLTEALLAADPSRASAYKARSTSYDARLAELDTWVRQQMATIPQANRKLVSFHEAFPYLAKAYGLEIVGTVVDAPGQDPSAGEIAALVRDIRSSGARAIFTEAQFSSDLSAQIAAETGIRVVSDLYNDSLGDPPVDSYEGLIRWDVERVVEALR